MEIIDNEWSFHVLIPAYLAFSISMLQWKIGMNAESFASPSWWERVYSTNGNLIKLCYRFADLLFDVLAVTTIIDSSVESLVHWNAWLLMVIAMCLLCHLSQLRLKNLVTYAPNINWTVYLRLVTLQIFILFANLGWFYFWYNYVQIATNSDQWLFATLSSLNLCIISLQSLVKYSIYLLDIAMEGRWEYRDSYAYMTDFFTKIITLFISFVNYFRLLLFILRTRGASVHYLVLIFVHISFLAKNLASKFKAYFNYRKLTEELNSHYKVLTLAELQDRNENCAICLYFLNSARQLPCGHIFHEGCLRSWLEHNHTCPTCRAVLLKSAHKRTDFTPENENVRETAPQPDTSTNNTNNMSDSSDFYNSSDENNSYTRRSNENTDLNTTDPLGSNDNRYAQREDGYRSILRFTSPQLSFLPQFSFEFVRNENESRNEFNSTHNNTDQSMEEMLKSVKNVFYDVPDELILKDLAETKDAATTISNICDGLLCWNVQVYPGKQKDTDKFNTNDNLQKNQGEIINDENSICKEQFVNNFGKSSSLENNLLSDSNIAYNETIQSLNCQESNQFADTKQSLDKNSTGAVNKSQSDGLSIVDTSISSIDNIKPEVNEVPKAPAPRKYDYVMPNMSDVAYKSFEERKIILLQRARELYLKKLRFEKKHSN